MIKKVKVLFVCFLGMGLAGCIVVPEDGVYSPSYYSYSSYEPYPIGSYEWATDYYHRPPAPRVHHHKHHKSDYRYKEHEHKKHIDKKPVDKKHIDKKHEEKKHADKKLPEKKRADKLHKKDVKHHDISKPKVDKKEPVRDFPKQNPGNISQKGKINTPDKKLIGHKMPSMH